MKPTILIQDSYYPIVLRRHEPTLSRAQSFDDAHSALMALRFGTSDAMSLQLSRRGWVASDVVVNSLATQGRWSHENGLRAIGIPLLWDRPYRVLRTPLLRKVTQSPRYIQGIFLRQVKQMEPDVVYLHDAGYFTGEQIAVMRKGSRRVVMQTGGRYPDFQSVGRPDLFVSPLSSHVQKAESEGVPSLKLPMAFDDRVLYRRQPLRDIDVSFVGTISESHSVTLPLLRAVAKHCPGLQIYGPRSRLLESDRFLAQFYRGEAWGDDMYDVLLRSKVALNRHVDWAGPHAANMRLFEATGCGATLVTDSKPDLKELFCPGREVLTFETVDEAGTLVRDLLNDPGKLDEIGRAGQLRTLSDHTYSVRMTELDRHLRRLLNHESDGVKE